MSLCLPLNFALPLQLIFITLSNEEEFDGLLLMGNFAFNNSGFCSAGMGKSHIPDSVLQGDPLKVRNLLQSLQP